MATIQGPRGTAVEVARAIVTEAGADHACREYVLTSDGRLLVKTWFLERWTGYKLVEKRKRGERGHFDQRVAMYQETGRHTVEVRERPVGVSR